MQRLDKVSKAREKESSALSKLSSDKVATTSCLNDNNDSPSYVPLTPEQKHALCIETSGTYQGYYYFLKNGENNKADSAQITFTVNDSTLIMNNYPVKSLGAYIQDTNAKSIIANAPAASLKFAFN